MCTAIALKSKDFYFGRTLDWEDSFGERALITPSRMELRFRMEPPLRRHYAMIGMGTVIDGYPLYADAVNSCGLCAAGLNFPGNAYYSEAAEEGNLNLAPYELIPYLLGTCADLAEAKTLLQDLNLMALPFRADVPLTPLHWMIADREGAVVVESTACGVRIYDDPAGVLTNNPPFGFHLQNLSHYGNLTAAPAKGDFLDESGAQRFGLGLGCHGLPGDYSSTSRFVRAAWLLGHRASVEGESACVAQFFHLLDIVSPIKGSVLTEKGQAHYTLYSSCFNAVQGVLYVRACDDPTVYAVDLCHHAPDGAELIEIEIPKTCEFRFL